MRVTLFGVSGIVYLLVQCICDVSGFASIRDQAAGTRYVRTLVDVFMNESHNTDVLSMLIKVIFCVKVYFPDL